MARASRSPLTAGVLIRTIPAEALHAGVPSVPGRHEHATRSRSRPPPATSSRRRLDAAAANVRSCSHRARLPVSGVSKPTRRNVLPPARIVSPSTTSIAPGSIGLASVATGAIASMSMSIARALTIGSFHPLRLDGCSSRGTIFVGACSAVMTGCTLSKAKYWEPAGPKPKRVFSPPRPLISASCRLPALDWRGQWSMNGIQISRPLPRRRGRPAR
jgi:hypothetical protein